MMCSYGVQVCPLFNMGRALYWRPMDMDAHIIPESRPDYEASSWLFFRGRQPVSGDPTSPVGFTSAYRCLAALTSYFTDAGGPWFSVSAQDIVDVHGDYVRWCQAGYREHGSHSLFLIPVSIGHLQALSTRRMHALTEFGGRLREDYPVYQHLHQAVMAASPTSSTSSPSLISYTVDIDGPLHTDR